MELVSEELNTISGRKLVEIQGTKDAKVKASDVGGLSKPTFDFLRPNHS